MGRSPSSVFAHSPGACSSRSVRSLSSPSRSLVSWRISRSRPSSSERICSGLPSCSRRRASVSRARTIASSVALSAEESRVRSMMCSSRSRPSRLRFGAGKPSKLADSSPRLCGQLQRAGVRGVELAQLGARECGALRGELLEAFAEVAQPRRAHRWCVGFGSQRGVLLHRFAGVVERECELAVVRASGGRELLDREVLVVALEHPPPRPREQLVTGRRLVSLVRVRGRRARGPAGRRGSAAVWMRGRARARCSSNPP